MRRLVGIISLWLCIVASEVTAQRRDDAARLVDHARVALRHQNEAEAARLLDEALTLEPRRVEALTLRAELLVRADQAPAAVKLLRETQRVLPHDVDLAIALGKAQLHTTERDAGVVALTGVAREHRRFDAHLALAENFLAASAWALAAQHYDEYLTLRPAPLYRDDTRHTLALADALLRSGELTRARVLFAGIAKQDPDNATARVGEAWTTAALDCGEATPLLMALRRDFPQTSGLAIVEGQCALASGDGKRALAHANAAGPSDRTRNLAIAAHAQVGEWDAAAALATTPAPTESTAVTWARALRSAGRVGEAERVLTQVRGSGRASVSWWTEWARVRLAQRDFVPVVRDLSPLVEEPEYVVLERWLGEALVGSERYAEAVPRLRRAAARDGAPRTRQWLAYALNAVGIEALRAGHVNDAMGAFAESNAIWPTAVAHRNLTIAGVASNTKVTVAPVARDSAVSLHVLARAHAAAGAANEASRVYAEAAAAARGVDAVRIAIDRAAHLLQQNQPVDAADVLRAVDKQVTPEMQAAWRDAFVTAQHAAALETLRDNEAAAAQRFDSITAGASRTVLCDAAWAGALAGRSKGVDLLRSLMKGGCPFTTEGTNAMPTIVVALETLTRRRPLTKLMASYHAAPEPGRPLAARAVRVVALQLMARAAEAGQLKRARAHLASARAATTDLGAAAIAINGATLQLLAGDVAAAITGLAPFADTHADAAVNLGIAYERAGNATAAVAAWRKAIRLGANASELSDWIAAKELFGAAP